MPTALPDHRPCGTIAESATPTLARPHPAAMAVNRAVSSHLDCVGLPWVGVPDSAIMRQGQWYSSVKVAQYTRGESARWLK